MKNNIILSLAGRANRFWRFVTFFSHLLPTDNFFVAKFKSQGMKPAAFNFSQWLGAGSSSGVVQTNGSSRQATEFPLTSHPCPRLPTLSSYRRRQSSSSSIENSNNANTYDVVSVDLRKSLRLRSAECQSPWYEGMNERIMGSPVTNRSFDPMEQFFSRKEKSPSKRLDLPPGNTDAIIDNIVLTIAYDHIIALKNEYSKLRGKNLWQRYKRMKAMIKSCMSLLTLE